MANNSQHVGIYDHPRWGFRVVPAEVYVAQDVASSVTWHNFTSETFTVTLPALLHGSSVTIDSGGQQSLSIPVSERGKDTIYFYEVVSTSGPARGDSDPRIRT